MLTAQPWVFSRTPDNLERAEVYDSSYSPTPADLNLAVGGTEKARALALYYKGYRLQKNRDLEGALAAYREVLELDPTNLPLTERSASLLARLGNFADSLTLLESALEKNPRNPRAYLHLAEHCATYHNGNDTIRARAFTTAGDAIDKFPTYARAHRFLIRLYLEDTKRDKAAEILDRALAQDSEEPSYWLSLGRMAQSVYPYRFGEKTDRDTNLAKVTKIYERALNSTNATLNTTSDVADFYAATKQYGDATSLYKNLVDAQPDDLDTREKLAQVYRIQGRDDDALATFEALVAIDPFNARIREKVAGYCEEQGELAKAAMHLLEAIKLGENKTENFGSAIELLLRTEQVEEAIRTTERATFLYPRNPFFPQQLALIYNAQEDYPAARTQYEKAEDLARNALTKQEMNGYLSHSFYFRYGAAVERTKDFDKAAELFRKSIDLTPEDTPELAAGAYNYLGYMWLENGMNIEESGDLIKYANELIPDNSAYVDSLGWFYFVKGDYEKALEELLRAADLLGQEYDTAFDTLLADGLIQESERSPDRGADPVVLDHLAQAYHGLGKIDEAVATLTRAVGLDGVTDDIRQRLETYRAELASPPSE